MNFKLKKIFLSHIFCLLIFSCSSDDDSNDSIESNLILKEFIEPNLNFGISTEEFLNSEGEPNEIIGTANYYNSSIDGIINYTYVLLSPTNENNDVIYYYSNVNIHYNKENLDFILNWLTNKYGVPAYFSVNNNNVNWYEWKNVNNGDYTVSLFVPGEDEEILVSGGNPDIRLSSTLFVEYYTIR